MWCTFQAKASQYLTPSQDALDTRKLPQPKDLSSNWTTTILSQCSNIRQSTLHYYLPFTWHANYQTNCYPCLPGVWQTRGRTEMWQPHPIQKLFPPLNTPSLTSSPGRTSTLGRTPPLSKQCQHRFQKTTLQAHRKLRSTKV